MKKMKWDETFIECIAEELNDDETVTVIVHTDADAERLRKLVVDAGVHPDRVRRHLVTPIGAGT